MANSQLPTSLDQLLAEGNYTEVAMTGSPDQWQTYAAMGLIGKTQKAIEGLSRFSHPEARFYSAVASWMSGDEATAIALLEKVPTPHAQNLLALLRKPRINVLAQMPWTRDWLWDQVTAIARDRKFTVQNISFHPEDLPNEPYANIHKFYDPHDPPDFYISQMVEWHIIPPNIQELPCPVFGQTTDYDLHVQAVLPWLQAFDELVVHDHTEWRDVRRLTGVPAATCPKSLAVPEEMPPPPRQPRDIDVFMSGSVLHPYHPEKSKLFHQILRVPGVNPLFISGFVFADRYYQLLGQSKASVAYCRHYGGMVSRGLEALSMGCGVVVQRGCVLTLYAGEQEGLLTYDFEADDLIPAIRRILDEWPEFEQRARRGAEIIRREFAQSRIASEYLRFLTFLAAKPRPQRQRPPAGELDQRRIIIWKGWTPCGAHVFQRMRELNLARWQARLPKEASPRLFIDMARELVIEHAAQARKSSSRPASSEVLPQALGIYRSGLARFPESLVLRFNFIRTALHFGQPEDVSEALKLAEETVGRPASSWQVDVNEDIFPWDFCSTFFDYRKYFDLLMEHLTQGTPVSSSLAQLILASVHYYLGRYSKSLDHLREATTLNPDFPFYKLWYAKQLSERGRPEDGAEAGALLVELTENSMAFIEAYRLLQDLQARGLFAGPQLAEVGSYVDRIGQRFMPLDDLGFETLQRPMESLTEPSKSPSSRSVTVHRCQELQTPVKVSVILVDWSRPGSSRSLDWLSKQTVPRDQYQIIWVELTHRLSPGVMDRADVVVTCGQDGFYHRPVGYNVGFMHAKGQVITVCHADAVFPPDFLESIMASFDLNSPGKPASMVLLHHERGTSEQCPGGLSDIGELRRYAWRDLSPGEGACMSFRKVDAIRLGGFDEHPIFRGHFVGPYDLQWRLGKAGVPEVWHDESVVLWRFSQAATSNVSSAFLWEVWSKFIYPGEKHRKWLFDSVYLPLQQNPEIRKLRRLLRWIVNLYKKQDAEALGLSGFTGLQKLFLYIRLLPEAAKLGRRRQKFQAWVLGKLSKLKDLFKGLVKFSRKRILTPVSHGMTKS